MDILEAVKKLNSISQARLNFRRWPILCITLYRNPIQASNFGDTFDQLFLGVFLCGFHSRCLFTSIPWCKKVKYDLKPKSREGVKSSSAGHISWGGCVCLSVVYVKRFDNLRWRLRSFFINPFSALWWPWPSQGTEAWMRLSTERVKAGPPPLRLF